MTRRRCNAISQMLDDILLNIQHGQGFVTSVRKTGGM